MCKGVNKIFLLASLSNKQNLVLKILLIINLQGAVSAIVIIMIYWNESLFSWQNFLIKCDTVVAYFIVFVTYSVIRSRVDGVWETFSLHTTLLFCAPRFSFAIKPECRAWSPEASSYPVPFFKLWFVLVVSWFL